MGVELAHEKRFDLAPEPTGMQTGLIARFENDVACAAAAFDLVAAAQRNEALLDAQGLLDDFECEKARRLHGGDALGQASAAAVDALDVGPDTSLVALGSNRMRQQRAEKHRRAPRHVFIEENAIPDGFRTGVDVNLRGDRLRDRRTRAKASNETKERRAGCAPAGTRRGWLGRFDFSRSLAGHFELAPRTARPARTLALIVPASAPAKAPMNAGMT